MNARYLAWLAAGASLVASPARGDGPPPTPASPPAAQDVSAPAAVIPTPPAADFPANPAAAAPVDANLSPAPMAPDQPTATMAIPDPKPGDTEATVIAALGKPNGVITLPDKYLLMFDRGNVVMSLQHVVLETRLLSPVQYSAKQAAQVAGQDAQRNSAAQANALLDLLLNDPGYVAMSTRDRLLALAKFDREHPGSDAHQDYLDLLAIYAAEQGASAKVADLQNQAATAKTQTLIAQQQAARAQQQLQLVQQQAMAAQQQAAQAQRQVAAPPPSPAPPAASTVGPNLHAGNGGIAISARGLQTQNTNPAPQEPLPTIRGNTISNVPPGGVEVVMPDGSIKYIPGNSTVGVGNNPTYF